MEKCGAHSCSDRFLKAGLIALFALLLCGAAIGAAAGAATPVSTADQLKEAVATANFDVILNADIGLSETLSINTTGTLDLGGHVLNGNGNMVIDAKAPGNLTLKDTHTDKDLHYFTYCEIEKWDYISTPTDAQKAAAKSIYEFDRSKAADKESIFYVEGGCITGGGGTDPGAGARISDGCEITMEGGNIVGNDGVSGSCGAVYVIGKFTMKNGNIVGNNGSAGGGVTIRGTFTMENGYIIGNYAYSGGGVYVYHKQFSTTAPGGVFEMKGGYIIGNRVSNVGTGGGVVVWGDTGKITRGIFKVSGTPVIKDNTQVVLQESPVANNVVLDKATDAIVLSGKLTGGEIHITKVNSKTPATGEQFGTTTLLSGSGEEYFKADGANRVGSISGGNLVWVEGEEPTPTTLINYGTTALTDQNITTQGPFAGKADYKFENGMHKLTLHLGEVINLEHALEIQVDTVNGAPAFTIDLNGGVIQRVGTASGSFSLITIGDGKGLTLQDNTKTKHYFMCHLFDAWTWIPEPTPEQTEGANPISAFDCSTAEDEDIFYVEGGCITGGTGTENYDPEEEEYYYLGGGVYNEGTFTMSGGNIVGNSATDEGGGVENYGTFEMSDSASIVGNIVEALGGGVENYGTFTMSDSASIIGNSAYYGGGVFVYNGTFTMSGSASITDNYALGSGGGVLFFTYGKFEVSGTPVIKDNIANEETNNVDDYGGKKLITLAGALEEGAEIHITQLGDGEVFGTAEDGASGEEHFINDGDPLLVASISDGDLVWVKPSGWVGDVFIPADSGYASAADLVTALNTGTGHENTADGSAAGTVKLLKDVKLGGTLKIGGAAADSFILDLGGKVLSADITKGDFSVITVDEGKYLKVIDSVSSAPHYFKYVKDGAWTYAGDTEPTDKYKVFILNGTGEDKFTREAADAAAEAAPEGKFVYIKVTGGVITGGSVNYGGGVYVYGNGNFTMTGGNIVGNTVDMYGGGVYVYPNGNFTMTGGSIAGNTAWDGGGVDVETAGIFTMSGSASIVGNSASSSGGGVYVSGSTFTMERGTIAGNSAGSAGGVYVNGTLNVKNTPVIKDNKKTTGTASNIEANNLTSIKLAGPLTGDAEIHITSPAAVGKFGEVADTYANPTQTDADHFVSDSTNPVLAAKLVEMVSPTPTELHWADAKKIEITQPTGGKITSLPLFAAIRGFDVSLTATADAGYEFDKWDVKADSTPVTVSEDKFEMPDSAVTVTATFKKSVSPKPSHKSSGSQGSSTWATEPVEPTETPTPTAEPTQSPTPGVPTVKPTEQPTPAKSPMPIMGILAGLGCAAVFGLRRR